MQEKAILISGGAGYLGRCTMDVLVKQGYLPVCVDNYSTGHRFESATIPCFETDLSNRSEVESLFQKLPPVVGIFHFAAKALVEESNRYPVMYFENNLLSTLYLAEQASRRKIPFVHSSSCAVYGMPEQQPITEETPHNPISPYGETKRSAENILRQFSRSQGLRVLNLRYFNPAGWIEGADHGERHEPETHVVPNVVRAGLAGKPVNIFGTDYPTPDGTCIRDFLHVEDLALGHLSALTYLQTQADGFFDAINLGSGKGSSVKEVIDTCGRILGRPVQVIHAARRPGDPAKLVADTTKAQRTLDWHPRHGLEAILRSQIAWESSHL